MRRPQLWHAVFSLPAPAASEPVFCAGPSAFDLDLWAATLDLSPECIMDLSPLDKETRAKVLKVLHSKMSQRNIQAPSQYLQGIIRNEVKGGTFSSWSPSSSAVSGPMLTVAAVQALASPQQQPLPQQRGVKRPAWVTEAWSLVHKPSAVMKKMHSVVGPVAMAGLCSYPASIQVSVVTALIYSEGAWPDPAAALKQACTTLATMPASPLTANRCGLRKQGRSIVGLQLGKSYGAEWVHLGAAMKELKSAIPDLALVARHAFLPASAAVDLYQIINSGVTLQSNADTFLQALPRLCDERRGLDATIVIFVNLPSPTACTVGAHDCPAYHSGESSGIWEIFRLLSALQPLSDNRYVLLCLDPKTTSSVADTFFGCDLWRGLPSGR